MADEVTPLSAAEAYTLSDYWEDGSRFAKKLDAIASGLHVVIPAAELEIFRQTLSSLTDDENSLMEERDSLRARVQELESELTQMRFDARGPG